MLAMKRVHRIALCILTLFTSAVIYTHYEISHALVTLREMPSSPAASTILALNIDATTTSPQHHGFDMVSRRVSSNTGKSLVETYPTHEPRRPQLRAWTTERQLGIRPAVLMQSSHSLETNIDAQHGTTLRYTSFGPHDNIDIHSRGSMLPSQPLSSYRDPSQPGALGSKHVYGKRTQITNQTSKSTANKKKKVMHKLLNFNINNSKNLTKNYTRKFEVKNGGNKETNPERTGSSHNYVPTGKHVIERIKESGKNKLILYWHEFFEGNPWNSEFTDEGRMRETGCPEWRCEFTSNRSLVNEADAIIFRSMLFHAGDLPIRPRPQQRWVYMDMECPAHMPAILGFLELNRGSLNTLVNWTLTYHSSSDVLSPYGAFLPVDGSTRPLRANLMSEHSGRMQEYMALMATNATLQQVMGPAWRSFVDRPRLAAWMASHCPTNSRREEYLRILGQYITIDTFGMCGTDMTTCHHDPHSTKCWQEHFKPNYLFYMAFENNMCSEYVTEKLYIALEFELVPVVWGGLDYDKVLPPHSYINARHHHPKHLAQLLVNLQKDPVALGRYHLWRKFWRATHDKSFCELCYKLHYEPENEDHHYKSIQNVREKTGQCQLPPRDLFSTSTWKKYITDPDNNTHSDVTH